MSRRTSQNSQPTPEEKGVRFCRSSFAEFAADEELELEPELEIRCTSGTVRLIRPHSISYHCKIGAAFPRKRRGPKPCGTGTQIQYQRVFPRSIYSGIMWESS